ncbi:hypothetical protein P8C59_004217 [Phyllachora maydis]|uniref:Glutaredoxin domain-containing protein n=1 Tax=Phyllachora maydis TaxID=1825666 RepID=A0AAD9MC81_9PEZI|nr:hypothetical protein P8C59_004217 [Phyllachora maydis]
MPPQRRLRLLVCLVIAGTVTLLFFTSHLRQTQTPDSRTIQDFYHKTVDAIDKAGGGPGHDGSPGTQGSRGTQLDQDGDGDMDADDKALARKMAERLRAAEQKAKDSANAKAPNRPDHPKDLVGVGSSAGGQGASSKSAEEKSPAQETDEEHAAETVLNDMLKRSPVIIFSKTYCPYSKKAKGLLLDKYHIDPAPYVVELDKHELGPQIQSKLADITGRRTVPNILVNGKSIGGSDEIAQFDREKTLVDKIKTFGGKQVEVTERFAEQDQKPLSSPHFLPSRLSPAGCLADFFDTFSEFNTSAGVLFFDMAARQTPQDVLLAVAEWADLAAVAAMMRSNRDTHRLLSHILSSWSPAREALQPFSFDVLAELELRARRIDELFLPDGLMFQVIQSMPSFDTLPPHELDKIIAGFKRGCAIVDRLADCAADSMMRARQKRRRTMDRHAVLQDARKAQIAFIETPGILSTLDHAWLLHLVSCAGMAYANARPEVQGDPDPWVKPFAFKETVMRQGSMALWALLGAATDAEAQRGKPTPSTGTQRAFAAFLDWSMQNVTVETNVWESGGWMRSPARNPTRNPAADEGAAGDAEEQDEDEEAGMLPSLHSTMLTSFAEKTGYDMRRTVSEADFLVLSAIRRVK